MKSLARFRDHSLALPRIIFFFTLVSDSNWRDGRNTDMKPLNSRSTLSTISTEVLVESMMPKSIIS